MKYYLPYYFLCQYSNRTIEELKFERLISLSATSKNSNRTIEELKLINST